MIEVHPNPPEALSDGAQSLFPDQFEELVGQCKAIASAIGRRLTMPLTPSPVGGEGDRTA